MEKAKDSVYLRKLSIKKPHVEIELEDEDSFGSIDSYYYDDSTACNSSSDSSSFDADAVDRKNAEKFTKGIVPETDDPTLPTFTFRAVLLGTFFNIILATTCAIFHFRTNVISVPPFLATLLCYPMGVFMAYTLPKGFLNPGPFNVKEHVIATVIASAGGGLPYGVDNVVVQRYKVLMGNENVTVWNSLAWVMCSQLIGFGIAGIARRFLVKPAGMLWPSVLSNIALFDGFHREKRQDELPSRFKYSRFQFFWMVSFVSFIYHWFPTYLIPAISTIPLLCLVSSSETLKFLGSSNSNEGPGIGTIALDWNYLLGRQMTSPYWATCNLLAGNVIWWWIVAPIIHYTNPFERDSILHFEKGHFNHTINSVSLFSSRTNMKIEPIKVMNGETYDLNMTAYSQEGPLRLGSGFVVYYAVSFMALSATVTHVTLWYGKKIWRQAKEAFANQDSDEGDIHSRLMRNYTDISEGVYLIFLIALIVITSLVCEFTPFHLPWYHIILAVTLSTIFIIPIGTIRAIAGDSIGLNILSQIVIGFISPGKTIWSMSFKSIGVNGIKQSQELLADLKLGHYMHIDPKMMVLSQVYGTLLGSVLNTFTSFYCMDVWLKDTLGQGEWNFTSYRTFYSAAAIWGSIGPGRFFGIGSLYQNLLWFFPLGFVLASLPYLGNKFFPSEVWHVINVPLLSNLQESGGKKNALISTFLVATASQFYAFRYHNAWFKEFNYITSVGIEFGSSMVALFAVLLQSLGIKMPPWAGTYELDNYCYTH